MYEVEHWNFDLTVNEHQHDDFRNDEMLLNRLYE
jgi:hypothetical protein